ncbi:hypothetical protein BJ944DRAFT_270742 [Cunninghamella echinulata]|nr:hypothetical protein BJ944DRAFT_270742 [Cunninghamella echinulata]
MDKSFAGLLRHSKLATYDRRLSQVYTTPKQYKQQGDWGLKRNLPSVIRTPYVTIGQLDSLEHQTPWTSGESQVVFIQRWKENFQHSFLLPKHYQQQQQQYADQDYYNLATISKHEFHSFLKKTLTPEVIESLHNALETKKITREQVYDYLNITFRPEPHRIKGPIYYTSSSMDDNNQEEMKNKDIIVTGRILNAQKGGYAVGIGGVVAFLPKTLSMGLRKPGNRHLVHQFKVKEAYITDQGKPRVIVSFHRPSPSLSPSTTTNATNSIIEPSSPSPLEKNKENISLPTISSSTFSLPTSSSTASLFNNNNNNNKNKKAPSSSSSSSWSSFSLDDLFSTAPPNNINDLHSFLIDQDLRKLKRKQIKKQHQQLQLDTNNTNHNNNEPSPSLSTSNFMNDQYLTSANELSEQHTVLMNRIVTLLKNGTVKK